MTGTNAFHLCPKIVDLNPADVEPVELKTHNQNNVVTVSTQIVGRMTGKHLIYQFFFVLFF